MGDLDPSRIAVVTVYLRRAYGLERAVEDSMVVPVARYGGVRRDEPAEYLLPSSRLERIERAADAESARDLETCPPFEVRHEAQGLIGPGEAVRPRQNKAVHGPARRAGVEERSHSLEIVLDMIEPVAPEAARAEDLLSARRRRRASQNGCETSSRAARGVAKIQVGVAENPRRISPVVIGHERERASNEDERNTDIRAEMGSESIAYVSVEHQQGTQRSGSALDLLEGDDARRLRLTGSRSGRHVSAQFPQGAKRRPDGVGGSGHRIVRSCRPRWRVGLGGALTRHQQ